MRVPTARIGMMLVVLVVLFLVGGGLALALFEPSPTVKHFEVPVPNDRFAR